MGFYKYLNPKVEEGSNLQYKNTTYKAYQLHLQVIYILTINPKNII